MGFRTVIIKNRAKLEVRLSSLIVRGEQEKKIFIDEINTLIIQSTAVSLTASLLCELMKRNVKVIFCDEKHNPQSELLPYYGAHNTSKRYKEQIAWGEAIKAKVWREIVKKKIEGQAQHLFDVGFIDQADLLRSYLCAVQDNDMSNREGHAAKVYFNCLLGIGNSRKAGGFYNGCLNYGYAVLLSAFNREIVSSGYLTQLGVWHDKYLLKNGFIMMQKSVYTKLVINNVTSAAVKQRIRNNVPNDGIVELLEITENQFSKIEYLVGEEQQLVIDTVDRLVEL